MKKIFFSSVLFLTIITLCSFVGGGNTIKLVEGRIIDDAGNPAVGAKVVLTETNNVVYTDFEGTFKFENINTSVRQKLKVSYIAHQELELEVNSIVMDQSEKVELYLESK